MQLECGVAEDRKTAIVAVDREMGAAELEKLTEDLMACRAELEPRRRPVMFPGSRILMGEGLHLQTDADGRMLIAVHHPGIGWVGAAISGVELTRLMRGVEAPSHQDGTAAPEGDA